MPNSTAVGQHGNHNGHHTIARIVCSMFAINCVYGVNSSAAALSLKQLTQLADQIVEASPSPATISSPETQFQLTTEVMELFKHLDKLTNQMSGVIHNLTKRYGHSPSPGRRCKRCSSTSREEDSSHPLC